MTSSWQEKTGWSLLYHDTRGVRRKGGYTHIRWVRGHTVDVENTVEDRLADCSTQPALQHLWWRRAPLNGGWEEEEFVAMR